VITTMRGIADYEFERELGAGGRGRYFLARCPARLGRGGAGSDSAEVAVKVFAQESTSEGFRRATSRLRSFAAIRSPYLADYYDVGLHDGILYQAMEYLAGGSLSAPDRPLGPPLRVRAIGDVARALSALHRAGIVHGAVKPANVLIDPYGAKLADPDLSQIASPGQRFAGVGPTAGIEFADPARLLGETAAPAHDVWSVGLLLHWVVTGDSGYAGLPRRDGLGALRRVVAGRPRLAGTLPGPVADIVRACLAPAADRPTAAEVADRVAAVAADMAAVAAEAPGLTAVVGSAPALARAPG